MRLFVSPFAPNVMRVEIVAREKGVALDVVDITADRAGYRAINPLGQVPALELDDGRVLTESLTICQYLDAAAAPHLFGDTPDERWRIAMWERRAETTLFNPAVEYGHHVHPMFGRWMPQFPDYAATLVHKAAAAAAVFAEQLDASEFIAGNRFTAADITALLGYFNWVAYGGLAAEAFPSLRRWSNELLRRDSMASLHQVAAFFGVALPV
jgi:glutathione S-transferase